MNANFDGPGATEEAAWRHQQHWEQSFAAQREFLLSQPDNGTDGVNKSAPSFQRLISLLSRSPAREAPTA